MPRRGRVLASVLAVPIAALGALAAWPAPADFEGDPATAGAHVGRSGLDRPFPAPRERPSNRMDDAHAAERGALGKLLFFDPVLSGKKDISCAHCHHPDLGYSDGRALSMGTGGTGLAGERRGGGLTRRSAPTIYDALYNPLQFWDGRAADLEEQALGPIANPVEMGADLAELEARLAAIPEYAKLFEAAFPGDGPATSRLHVGAAIAAYERTLTANDAPFDRYVAGDRSALTERQRRGFDLFRSGKTRCFECHGLPTFANPDFKVIGVPDLSPDVRDHGRAEIAGGPAYDRAFKVPTLRNVALTAPYMHDGMFNSLGEVIDFYARGGGPGMGEKVPNLDDKVRKFEVTAEEKEDLVAFLCALTDESKRSEIPERVPSGLPVVGHIENPGRALAAKYNVARSAGAASSASASAGGAKSKTILVGPGQSIRDAVSIASPGDVVEVAAGVYHETVTVDRDGVKLRPATGARPVLDGDGKLSDAVIATGSSFTIEGFEIRHYKGNGVVVQNAKDVAMRDLVIDDTGLYGVYPVGCTGVTVESVTATGIADAAIYVGQSRDIVVRGCDAHASVTGIEIENSLDALVEKNLVHDCAGGILVFVLPNNPSKVGARCRVLDNRVIENNHENFGNPTSIVSHVPSGAGILVMAADDTEVAGNTIEGNASFGVAVTGLGIVFDEKGTTFDVGAIPERTFVHGNRFARNGAKPAKMLTDLGLAGADLLWDLSGWSNRWDEPGATRATPILEARWPEPARLAAWRILRALGRS